MKTNLPESRNRNLPPPPAHAAAVEARRRLTPPEAPTPDEPGRATSALRSFVVMLIIGGLFAGGIWYYLRGAETEARANDQLFNALTTIGTEIWETGNSLSLTAETDEAREDLNDLPRVVSSIRALMKDKNVKPRIVPIEGDPGRGNASHHLRFSFENTPMLVIRLNCRKDGGISFLGEASPIVPSRREFLKSLNPESPGNSPGNAPAPALLPATEDKVSEPPANPQ